MSLSLDPAQLVALHALLQEQHVSRAAARLHISQSSMSYRLAQLREGLGDELLVRRGRSLVRTPRAERMLPALDAALRDLERALAPETRV